MGKIWITSDWHFNHQREFIYIPRGFSSVEEMNEAIIARHNKLVQPEDDVYVLGDLMLGDSEKGIECIKRMNGKLHIVRGNHDTDRRWELYKSLPNVVEMDNAIYLKYKKHNFYMSHYISLTGNLEKESLTQMTLNLFGHTHQKDNFYMDMPYLYHVGVDSHNCSPVLLDDIIEEMHQKVEECKRFLDEQSSKEEHEELGQEVDTESCTKPIVLPRCERCVWSFAECPGPTRANPTKCPDGHTYKRDPPDGGYYG